ncbi:uncharacterized protein LOC120345119 [Styela clava]
MALFWWNSKTSTFFMMVVVSICARQIAGKASCRIPKINEDINWKEMSKTWYLGLHTNDVVMSKDIVYCCKSENVTSTSYGGSMMITEYHQNSPASVFPAHFIRQDNGVYAVDKNDDDAIIEAESRYPDGKTNENAARFDKARLDSPTILLSDGKNYLIYAWCVFDKWIVWTQFSTSTPTQHQINEFQRALDKYGINADMYPCQQVDANK